MNMARRDHKYLTEMYNYTLNICIFNDLINKQETKCIMHMLFMHLTKGIDIINGN